VDYSVYYQKDRAFEEFLRYIQHDGDGIVLLKPNGFLVGWEFVGPDMLGTSWDDLSYHADIVASVLSTLDARWTVHITTHHRRGGSYPAPIATPHQVISMLDQERRVRFEELGEHYVNVNQLWLAWYPDVAQRHFIDRLVGEEPTRAYERSEFLRTINGVEQSLRPHFRFFQRLNFEQRTFLGRSMTVDRITQALGTQVYGHFGFVAADLDAPMFLSYLLAAPVEMQPDLIIGDRFIDVISLRTYPRVVYPGLLEHLRFLRIEHRLSVRITPYSTTDAKKALGRISRLHQIGSIGLGVVFQRGGSPTEEATPKRWREEAKDAQAQVDAGETFCAVLPQIVLYARSQTELDSARSDIKGLLEGHALIPLIENRRNRFFAYMGSLPGECDANAIRRARMPMRGATRIAPLTGTWYGPDKHPDHRFANNDAPLLMLSTAAREPFSLYLHEGESGHTLLVGPPGRGKSHTLRAYENGHLARYFGARVLAFDIDKSAYKFTHAIHGQHYMLGLGHGPQIAPLTGMHDPEQFEDILSWVITFVELWRPNAPVTPQEQRDLRASLLSISQTPHGRLSDFAQALQHEELRLIFEQVYGSMLDAETDRFDFETAAVPYWCFEIGALGVQNHRWTVPTMLYLQRRAFAEFARGGATPTLVTLDEGARALKIPNVANFAERIEREGRKNRVQFLFATQGVEEILQSELRSVFIGMTVTKIALHDSAANTSLKQGYMEVGFTEADCATIAKLGAFQALVRTAYGVQVVEMNPTPLEIAILGGASAEDSRHVDDAIARYGRDAWLAHYLEATTGASVQKQISALRMNTALKGQFA